MQLSYSVSWILAISLMSVQIAKAFECSSACGHPGRLDFCSDISFGVCATYDSWEEQDQHARMAFERWGNTSDTPLALLLPFKDMNMTQLEEAVQDLGLRDLNSDCASVLKKIQCAVDFPACEIGRASKRLCQASCKSAIMTSCPLLGDMCQLYSASEVEAKAECFKLDYIGPSVGIWIAGFVIAFIFSIFNTIGINLQKVSLTRTEISGLKLTSFQQPLWVLGFALVCIGSMLDFVAFGMAPQSLLAPLAALSLVWNMMVAPYFHDEKVTRQGITATVIIFAGVILTVVFAGHSTPEYELQNLIDLYKQSVMYAYMFFVSTFLAGLFSLTRYIERTHNYEGGIYHIVCYGGIAGTFGGQSVLFAKSTVELLKSAIWGVDGANVFKSLAFYVILSSLCCCLAMQVRFLNGGLARFDALVVIPVYQSFWIVMSVLGGIMYFEEYVSMTKLSICMFTLGALITITGIVYLLKTRNNSSGSNQYVDLSVTPISAWNVEDSDEEEIQLKLANKWEDIDIGAPTAKVTPAPSNTFGSNTNASIASAIHRTMPNSTKSKFVSTDKDDDLFFK